MSSPTAALAASAAMSTSNTSVCSVSRSQSYTPMTADTRRSLTDTVSVTADLSDVGVGTGFADHGAAGDGPAGHAVGDVERVPPGTGQRLRGIARARARSADHVHLAVARDLVGARGDLAEPDVNGVRRVPGRPLVVLAHVEQEDPGRQVR